MHNHVFKIKSFVNSKYDDNDHDNDGDDDDNDNDDDDDYNSRYDNDEPFVVTSWQFGCNQGNCKLIPF